jgi:hypothetical protein
MQVVAALKSGQFDLSDVEVRQLLSSFHIDAQGNMDAHEVRCIIPGGKMEGGALGDAPGTRHCMAAGWWHAITQVCECTCRNVGFKEATCAPVQHCRVSFRAVLSARSPLLQCIPTPAVPPNTPYPTPFALSQHAQWLAALTDWQAIQDSPQWEELVSR